MNATTLSTRRLEAVLRALATDDDLRVPVAAAKHLPAGTKLADFIAEIWAWLKHFNAGNRSLSPNRIDSALAKEPTAEPLAPAVRKRVEKALDGAARGPKLPPVNEEDEPRFGPPRTEHSAPNNGAAPWLKKGTRPRANGLKTWRATIVGIAAGNEAPTAPSWWAFATNWFKTAKPTPGQAAAFLKWLDEKPATPAAKNGGGIKADEPAPAAAKPAKRKYTRRGVVTAAPSPEAPLAPRGDGFKELEITYGRKVEHDARYSGDKVQSPCFSVSSRLFPLSKGKASRIRLFWNGEARTCAAILGDTAGLKMQQAHGTQRAISTQLPALFGKAEIYFKAVKAPKDYDLMFEAVAHET